MKPEIAKLWVHALRSGKYKQGVGFLYKDGKYCCLGVLCELAISHGVKVETRDEAERYYNGSGFVLPLAVRDWAGFHDRNFNGDFGDPHRTLASENDNGLPFSKIADIIEQNVDKL